MSCAYMVIMCKTFRDKVSPQNEKTIFFLRILQSSGTTYNSKDSFAVLQPCYCCGCCQNVLLKHYLRKSPIKTG